MLGSSGRRSNGVADDRARLGGQHPILDPERAMGISYVITKKHFLLWEEKARKECKQAKVLVGEEKHNVWAGIIIKLIPGMLR